MFIWVLVGLFCLSLLLSVFSLWKDLKKNIKTEHVTEELSKGRVIFHASSTNEKQVHTDDSFHDIESSQPEMPITPHVSPLEHTIVQEHTEASITEEPIHKEEVYNTEGS